MEVVSRIPKTTCNKNTTQSLNEQAYKSKLAAFFGEPFSGHGYPVGHPKLIHIPPNKKTMNIESLYLLKIAYVT